MNKMKMKNLVTKCFIIIVLLLLFGCKKDIIITRDYIYNASWGDRHNPTGFSISRLIGDKYYLSFDSISSGFDIYNLIKKEKVKIDSSYSFYIKPNSLDNVKKVYFSKKQQSIYFGSYYHGRDKNFDIIGKLKLDSWYRITNLEIQKHYYLYVHENGDLTIWKIVPGAW